MSFRIEVDLRLRTQHCDRVRWNRLRADVFANFNGLGKWICAIDHPIGFSQRSLEEKVGFCPHWPCQSESEQQEHGKAKVLCAEANGVESCRNCRPREQGNSRQNKNEIMRTKIKS